MTHPPPDQALERVIGFWGGLAVIVGITIGSGIFRKPHTLARDVGDPAVILGLWVGFGVVSLCGALALAELSSMLPHTGGVYVYLRARLRRRGGLRVRLAVPARLHAGRHRRPGHVLRGAARRPAGPGPGADRGLGRPRPSPA